MDNYVKQKMKGMCPYSTIPSFERYTLRTRIKVRSGINVLVGNFSKNNKRTVWNNHTGGKILLQIHRRFGIKAKNFYIKMHFAKR